MLGDPAINSVSLADWERCHLYGERTRDFLSESLNIPHSRSRLCLEGDLHKACKGAQDTELSSTELSCTAILLASLISGLMSTSGFPDPHLLSPGCDHFHSICQRYS